MKIRKFLAWPFLAAVLALGAWRAVAWAGREVRDVREGGVHWAALGRRTTEELDRELAYRYRDLARDLGGEPEVGYFNERDRSALWSDSSPEGAARIKRYYMAQGIVPPSVLRFDERWPRVVVDCRTPEEAAEVVRRMRLAVVRDYGEGLLLARPES